MKRRAIETIEQANSRIQEMERRLEAVEQRAASIDPPAICTAAELAKNAHEQIKRSMGVMVLKLSVATEMPRYFRAQNVDSRIFLPKLLGILDLPDTWWIKHSGLSMESWARVIAKAEAAG